METTKISRRQLLKGTGVLVVSFTMWPAAHAVGQTEIYASSEPRADSLDSWLAMDLEGNVTVFTSKVDLGTGVLTALSQIVAEELDVPFSRIHMETGDTSITIDQAATVGSATIERGGPQLRQAAAAARQQLLILASGKLGAPVDRLTVSEGVVSIVDNPGKKVSYAELVGGKRFDVKITATGTGGALKIAPEVRPKDPATYKIVGTSVPRVDLPPKFTGQFTYTGDVRLPGMLHGRVVRPPAMNSVPASVDETSVKNIAGVVKVVREGNFVGVVAETEWAAIQAAKKLNITWSKTDVKYPSTRDEVFEYLKNTKSIRDQEVVMRGNPEATLSKASNSFDATYRWPFQVHGMISPSCAVADVQRERITIWAGSQGTFNTRKQVADMLGVSEKMVRVIYRESAGCYGRLSPDDVPLDAVLMSRAVGKPVRVQWMRDDEHGWGPKGPAQLITVRASVDNRGKVTAWDYMDRSFPWTENGNPLLASRQIGRKPATMGNSNGTGGGGQIYDFENQKVIAALIPWQWPDPMPLRTSNLRAPGDVARCFASECAIDELAAKAGSDPVAFRLQYLKDKRIIDVLNAATERAKWTSRKSPSPSARGNIVSGRGIAVADRSNTMTAVVADVGVDKSTGKIAVQRITLAHDCGLVVNPNGLTMQIEGNVIHGVSRTLFEEVRFDASGIQSLDWVSYPVAHFPDVPEIDVVLLNHQDMPALGGGEPSLVPIPAAIANAVFDAAAIRLREVPMTPERVLKALKS